MRAFCVLKMFDTAVKPLMRAIQGFFCILIFTGPGGAFIKSHNDIGSQRTLDVNCRFRSELMP